MRARVLPVLALSSAFVFFAHDARAQQGGVAPGEFEPIQEILLGTNDSYQVSDLYPGYVNAVNSANVPIEIYVDSDYVKYDLVNLFQQNGVSDANVTYTNVPLDSIWIRDYGPLFTRGQNQGLTVVDLDYYPGRPHDDALPQFVAQEYGFGYNALHLSWEGGNFTSDGRGDVFCTDRMFEENSGMNAADVQAAAEQAFLGHLTVLEQQLHDGGTGHLDMFCLLTGASSAIVSRFADGTENHDRMERSAAKLADMGFNVTRLDLADASFSSYSNAVLVNGVAIVPQYANPATDRPALDAYAAAGFQVFGVDCRRIIQEAGAIHCTTITIPATGN